MPLYDYLCECSRRETKFQKIAELDSPVACACGKPMQRQLSAPMLAGVNFTPFISPGSGKLIDSPAARDNDLRATRSFLYEKGVEKDIARNRARTEEKAFAPIAAAVDNTVRELMNCGKLEG
jgi:putative FmdB family regulatory protein